MIKKIKIFYKEDLFFKLIVNFFLFFTFFFIILKSFSSPNIQYIYNFNYFTNKEYYTEDILLSHSVFFKSSIYYKFFNLFKIDLDNSIVQLILHILINLSSIFFIFLTIKKFTQIKNNYLIFIFIIILSTKYFFVLEGTISSWAFGHNISPSVLAHAVNYIILYLILNRSTKLVILLSIINILISIKVAWFMIALSFFYIVLFEERIKKIYAIILPIFSILTILIIYQGNLNFAYDAEISKELYNFTLDREMVGFCQAIFSCKSKFQILWFISTFFLFFFLNKVNSNNTLKKIFNLILLIQILIFLFFFLVDYFNIRIWQLLALSPVRAASIYEFCLCFLIIDFLLNKKKNINLIFYLLIFYFFGLGAKGYYIAFFLILILIILNIKRTFKNFYLSIRSFVLILITIFFLLQSYLFINHQLKKNYLSLKFFKEEKNLFLYDLTEEKYEVLKKLKKCKDFIFHDLDAAFVEKERISNWSNLIAKKSHFYLDSTHFYGNIKKLKENQNRSDIIASIHKNLRENQINNLSSLDNKKVVFIINKKFLRLFDKVESKSLSKNYNLIFYGYIPNEIIHSCSNI